MLSFTIGTLIVLAALCFFTSVSCKAIHTLYKKYKFVTSTEFHTLSQSLSKSERLSYAYRGLSKLIGALFFVIVAMILIKAPAITLSIPAAILFAALYYNSKILKELKRV